MRGGRGRKVVFVFLVYDVGRLLKRDFWEVGAWLCGQECVKYVKSANPNQASICSRGLLSNTQCELAVRLVSHFSRRCCTGNCPTMK